MDTRPLSAAEVRVGVPMRADSRQRVSRAVNPLRASQRVLFGRVIT
jgi:hypothetical protein